MKIKELTTWPPKVAGGRGEGANRTMADAFLGVVKQGDKTNFLIFKMRDQDRQEYSLYFSVPEDLVDKIIMTVTSPREITLEQVGELEIFGT